MELMLAEKMVSFLVVSMVVLLVGGWGNAQAFSMADGMAATMAD